MGIYDSLKKEWKKLEINGQLRLSLEFLSRENFHQVIKLPPPQMLMDLKE